MAVARPQVAGGSTGLKAAVIVFAVLTVASVGGTIYLFTLQQDLESAAQKARADADDARKKSADQAEQFSLVARDVTGERADKPAAIRQALRDVREQIRDKFPMVQNVAPRGDLSYPVLVDLLTELASYFSTKTDDLKKAQERGDQLEQRLKDAEDKAKQKEDEFTRNYEDLNQKYEKLVQDNAEFSTQQNAAYEKLKADHEARLKVIGDERDQERQSRIEAEAERDREKERAEKLLAQLAEFKPTGEQGSILQSKDGSIVRTFASSDIVYIDLGRREGLKPDMTFSVYAASQGIPPGGKGKATIRVNEVFETTAECQVTTKTPGDPIVQGDIIANPVFDRYRQYVFAVAGDFDLNFDGKIEDPGGFQVRRLIERAGGKLTDQVDTRTDFVVLGAAPALPGKIDPATATPADAARAEQMQKNYDAFELAKKEAQSLSIQILTRTRFLHFLGYGMPGNVPDDELAS